jgi:hypothetical protein
MLERGKRKRYQIAILAAIPCGSTYRIGSTICIFLFGEEIGTDSLAQGALSYRTARWRPARWQQHGGCGGFTGTVRECANARAFVFVLGRGQRDDSADGIVVVGSDGGARCDVHRGRRRRRLYSKNSTCTILSPTGKPITSFLMIAFLYSREYLVLYSIK